MEKYSPQDQPALSPEDEKAIERLAESVTFNNYEAWLKVTGAPPPSVDTRRHTDYIPPSKEQLEINQRGVDLARQALELALSEGETPEETRQRRIDEMARQDRDKRF